MEKMILTDADGVLLNWEFAFDCWMEARGHKKVRSDCYDMALSYGVEKVEIRKSIKLFNESAAIGFLPPHRDAMHYVKRLHEEHGFVFRVITSLSLDPHAQKLRAKNLKKLFGTAIESVICLDTGADKDEALAPYEGSEMYWVEDKVENAEVGAALGLTSLLMEHRHNMDYAGVYPIQTVRSWKDIYEIVTGESA